MHSSVTSSVWSKTNEKPVYHRATSIPTLTYSCWNSSRLSRPLGQSFRKPLYHCLSSCSLNSVFFTRSSITSGVILLFCFPMVSARHRNQNSCDLTLPGAVVHFNCVNSFLLFYKTEAICVPPITTIQKVGVGKFFLSFLCWPRRIYGQKCSKYYYLRLQFIPVMAKFNFQHHYSSLLSHHDPLEIILISWFGAQKHFLSSMFNCWAVIYWYFFQYSLMNRNVKGMVFWKQCF